MKILDYFQHIVLTSDQHNAVVKIQDFLSSDEDIFILQGYAGSGKTTLLKGLVDYLRDIEQRYQLMAPTGRAAKVINQKTGFDATTIHKGIYSFGELQEVEVSGEENNVGSYMYYYKLCNNPDAHNSIFIIDEASMVSDIPSQGEFFRFGSGYLLKDLVEYANIDGLNSTAKIIFIGDPAQLPPIGMNFSPALDENYLKEKYNLKIASAEIKEVKRQDANNGILGVATKIRKCLTSKFFNDFDLRGNDKDIFNPKFEDFLETYKSEQGTKVIISYKNKTALDLNLTIRKDKYGSDLPIQSGDIVIIGGNNYRIGIMNGEFGVVANVQDTPITREVRFYKKNGKNGSALLSWRQIELLMPDGSGQDKVVKGYMLDNFLNGDNYLRPEEQQAMFVDFKNRHPKLKPKTEEYKKAISTDPFFNCILLKYGYAVTCHKAQGGEWDATFVFWDKGANENSNFCSSQHNRTGKTNSDFYRWAYTAVTRASKKLYAINPPYFDSFTGMSFIDANVQKSLNELTGKAAAPTEVEILEDSCTLLQHFNIENSPISIQNHLLLLNYITKDSGIEITSWKKVGFEIRYSFKREMETASLKFWINGKNEFKGNFQKLPSLTNSDSLFEDISQFIGNAPNIVFVRNSSEVVIGKIDFACDLEEERPFLKSLFDALQFYFKGKNISIAEISHYNFRERYMLVRSEEKALIDFEYNGDGFFGRVLPIEAHCNSANLLNDIRKAVSNLKGCDYVV